MRHALTTCALLLIGSAPSLGQNQVVVTGTVIDQETRFPIPLVNVMIRGTAIGAATDTNGTFVVKIPVGDTCVLSFSHIAYDKVVRSLDVSAPKEITIRQRLPPASVRLPEVIVTASTFREMRAIDIIDGEEFERLGEPRLERALKYMLPFLISPLKERMFNPGKDFTLYVDDEWYESIMLDDFNPFAIRKVAIWGALESPVGYPARRGGYVIAIWTKNDDENPSRR